MRFIAKDNPDVAVRFGNALIDRVSILENFPLIGSPYSKRPGVRKLVSRPYLIFYRLNENENENTVEVLRYWHSAQRNPDMHLL